MSADRWVLVPVEPTPEMLKAADDGDLAYTRRNFGLGVHRVMQGPYDHWHAMIAAAPAAPAAEPDKAAWWALVMNAAASIEDAAACLRDPDAKRQAEGAMAHFRAAAQKLYAGAAPAAESPEPLTMPTDEQIETLREDAGIAWTGDFYRCESLELGAYTRAVIAEFCKSNGIGSKP